MLKSLSIQNYALIDSLSMNVEQGFTAITGETGSGKSILLGAFGLLLGERADTKSMRDESRKCIVEAEFDLSDMRLESFFANNDLDYEATTTIRREIAPGGKSRAFINDSPVQLQVLRILGSQLVDIHSQHENSLLADRAFQLSVIDAFAGNSKEFKAYQAMFQQWQSAVVALETVRKENAQWQQEMDYVLFQLQELAKANLAELNQSQMEEELNTLTHAEQIKGVVFSVCEQLDGERGGAISLIGASKSQLAKVASHNAQMEDFLARLESSVIELRELKRELEAFADYLQVDDRRAEQLNERLSALYQLQKKHRLQTVEELRSLEESLNQKANRFGGSDEQIAVLEKQVAAYETSLHVLAETLHQTRLTGARKAESEIGGYFSMLSMEHAEVAFITEPGETFHSWGKDEVAFLFKANKGGRLQPIQKIASGGEVSRVMLAIKASIGRHRRLPVLILDEIDQGVSGEVGLKIGLILKEMSSEMQLIAITHLPQIAGKADSHWKVRKYTDESQTYTQVVLLGGDNRINELAEMLSGKKLTPAALANARELMT